MGKTSLLRAAYPEAPIIQLLKNEEFSLYQAHPERLRERVQAGGWRHVIIDEIQKVPQLLDEVDFLIEDAGVGFALCGSKGVRCTG